MELVLVLLAVALFVIWGIVTAQQEQQRIAAMSAEDREKYLREKEELLLTQQWGPMNSAMRCPHCNEKGQIRTRRVKRKKGISGGKATGAILTGGVSILATGLSRKEPMTHAYCCNCKNQWDF